MRAALVLCLLVALAVAKNTLDVPYRTLSVVSNDYPADITFVEAKSDATAPRFTFTLNGLNYKPSMEEFVMADGASITLEYSGSSNLTSVASVHTANVVFSLFALLIAAMSGGLFGKYGAIVAFVAFIGAGIAESGPRYNVTIEIPEDWSFTSVSITGDGSVDSRIQNYSVVVGNLNVDLCSDTNSEISLGGFAVQNYNLCAGSVTEVDGSLNPHTGGTIEAQSQDVSITVGADYIGVIQVSASRVVYQGENHCEVNSIQDDITILVCGNSNDVLEVMGNVVTINFLPSDKQSPTPTRSPAPSRNPEDNSASVTPSAPETRQSRSPTRTPSTTNSAPETVRQPSASRTRTAAETLRPGQSPSTTRSAPETVRQPSASSTRSAPETRQVGQSPSTTRSAPETVRQPSASSTRSAPETRQVGQSPSTTRSAPETVRQPSASSTRSAPETRQVGQSPSTTRSAPETVRSSSATPTRVAGASPSPTPTSGCNRDSPASDSVPPSGPVASSWSNPGISTSLNTKTFWGSAYWKANEAPAIDQVNANTVAVRTIDGDNPDYGYIYTKDGIVPDVVAGASYTFYAQIWQDPNNRYWDGSTVLELTDLTAPTTLFSINLDVDSNIDEIQDNIWSWFENGTPGDCSGNGWNDCVVYTSQAIFNGVVPTAEADAISISCTFTLPSTGTTQLVFRITYPGNPSVQTGCKLYLKNIAFERADQPRSFPGLLISVPNQRVDNVRPQYLPTPTQSNCPHLRSGLVDWHNPSIWPGGVVPPADGRDVTLPAGQSVLISSCSIPVGPNFSYGTITVPANSQLIFNDAPITLVVGNILVNGQLWIGSETCRLYSHITITLKSNAANLGGIAGARGITTSSTGTLDIHGKLYQYTWTHLAASAWVGDDRIVVQDNVNWEVGQQIVITTSVFTDHWTPQNEVVTIVAIQGKQIQFTPRLEFYHYAGNEYQSEVALLSRRILIQGDDASENTKLGGHILANGPVARFSGVQTYRMGQLNTLARYPFHFHNMGESPLSFFQDCSVYHSFYRCFTVHGTNSTRLSRNTAFDVQGHCFYLEDGVEEHNLFEYNLAAYPQPLVELDFNAAGPGNQAGITVTQSANLLIPADAAPSGFYISNANNRFLGNSASGGFAGFTFINFPKPIGTHRSWNMIPEERPLAQFYGNTAHSASYQWDQAACIYTGGSQEYTGTAPNEVLTYSVGRNSRWTLDDNGDEAWMTFDHSKVYLCNRGLNHWGERVEITNYEAYDFTRSATLFGEAWMDNAYLNTRSANPLVLNWPPVQQFQYYDTYVKTILTRVTFANLFEIPNAPYTWSGNYAIVSMTHSDKFKPQGINAARDLRFENIWPHGRIGNYIEYTGSSRYYHIVDWDGTIFDRPFGAVPTLLGSANVETYNNITGGLVVQQWWNVDPSCILYPDEIMYVCRKQQIQEIANLYFDVDQLTNNVATWPDDWTKPCCQGVGTVSQFGYTGANRRSTIITANPGVTGVTGDSGWYLNFDRGSPNTFYIRAKQVPLLNVGGVLTNTYVIFAIKYPAAATFTITTTHLWKTQFNGPVTSAATFDEMYNEPSGTKYYTANSPSGEKWLFLKVIDRHYLDEPVGSNYFERGGVRLYNVDVFYWYTINVSCAGCPSQTTGGVTYYTVRDEVPNFVSNL